MVDWQLAMLRRGDEPPQRRFPELLFGGADCRRYSAPWLPQSRARLLLEKAEHGFLYRTTHQARRQMSSVRGTCRDRSLISIPSRAGRDERR